MSGNDRSGADKPGQSPNPWTQPFAQWVSSLGGMAQGPANQVYKEWETWLGAQMERLARNETFLGQMAKALEGSFQVKAYLDRVMETSAKAMRMPVASDLDAVTKRLDALERRMEQVAASLERVEQALRSEPAASARRPKPAPEKP